MKKFKLLSVAALMLAALALAPRWGFAASPFHVTVSTVVPNGSANGSAQYTAAGYPNYTGPTTVRHITLDYTTTSSSQQSERVMLWNNCTSSTAVTEVWSTVIQSSATTGLPGNRYDVDLTPRLMSLTSPCFSKTATDSNATIKATLFYE